MCWFQEGKEEEIMILISEVFGNTRGYDEEILPIDEIMKGLEELDYTKDVIDEMSPIIFEHINSELL